MTSEDQIQRRRADYQKGERITAAPATRVVYTGKQASVFVTVDVQQSCLWAVAREWADGGDSGLIDWRRLVEWEQLDNWASELNCTQVFVDAHYARRALEVFDYCASAGGYPCFGEANMRFLPWRKSLRDPYEGKAGAGSSSIACLTWNPNIFKLITMDLMRGRGGHEWMVYDGIERDYVVQVTSEQLVNGAWEVRRGRKDNHLWDCEVLQVLAANVYGVFRSEWLDSMGQKGEPE
jgi:hypothetical protein